MNTNRNNRMSAEFWAIIAVGVAVLGQTFWLDGQIERSEARLNARIDRVETKLEAKIDQVEVRLEAKIDQVEARLEAKIDQVEARLEAKIDGIQLGMAAIRERIAQVEGRLTVVEGRLALIERHVGSPEWPSHPQGGTDSPLADGDPGLEDSASPAVQG